MFQMVYAILLTSTDIHKEARGEAYRIKGNMSINSEVQP